MDALARLRPAPGKLHQVPQRAPTVTVVKRAFATSSRSRKIAEVCIVLLRFV